jgi:hypothetical protein
MTPDDPNAHLTELRVAVARLEERIAALSRELAHLAAEESRRDESVKEWLRPMIIPIVTAFIISGLTSTFAVRQMTAVESKADPTPRPSGHWPGPTTNYPPPVPSPPPLDWHKPHDYPPPRPSDR